MSTAPQPTSSPTCTRGLSRAAEGQHGTDQPWHASGLRQPGQSAHTRDSYIAILSALAIAIYLISKYVFATRPAVSMVPLYITVVVGGGPLLIGLARRLIAKQFGSDLLAGISILTAVLLGEYLVAAIVVLMLSGGSALEQYATERASAVLHALAKRMPRIAHCRSDAGIVNVPVDDVGVGDTLVIFPHEICPVDGMVVEGLGTMDEAYLTGEPFQISKAPGAAVISGAINGESALTITATRVSMDSRYAKIMQVMQEAERTRPQMRRIGDRVGAWYTLLALAAASLGWLAGGTSERFLAVLVIATPCPLLIAIPVVIIGAISLAARRSIIIKNAAMLEKIDSCRTLIFDKTGTLTYGKPALTDILCAPGVSRQQALQIAASLEQYSKHPLAAAILRTAGVEGIDLASVSQISEKPGEGLRGIVGQRNAKITGRRQIAEDTGMLERLLPPVASGMECILLLDGSYAATFRFHDEPRRESRSFVRHLKPYHHVTKIMLLSGDREGEVRYLADHVGIREVLYGKSPEEKLAIVREEARCAPTLFVGDGLNDAPAMQAATVGVAFGHGSDITVEAADAVVLEGSLNKVDELIHIGRRMRRIALQSSVGGMALSMAGMLAAALGYLPPISGAVAQEFIDLLAVLNALRMAIPAKELSDI
jgi:heavy metal translocating P-type ATPase